MHNPFNLSSINLNKTISKLFGFSLLELMVVIVITSLLTYAFISNYTAYVTKTQIANTINLLQSYRKKVEGFYLEHNTFGNNGFNDLNDIGQLELNTTSGNSFDFISAVNLQKVTTTNNPSIILTARFNDKAVTELRNKEVYLTISLNSDGIFTNACSGDSSINQTLLPKDCQNIN